MKKNMISANIYTHSEYLISKISVYFYSFFFYPIAPVHDTER